MILAADIGGTNSRFAIFSKNLDMVEELVLPSQDFANFNEMFNTATKSLSKDFAASTIAVAGPVRGDGLNTVANLTNLPWTISLAEISKNLALKKLRLVNDVIAASHSLPLLSAEDLSLINKGFPSGKNSTLLSLGTGVGIAFFSEGLGAFPSEAGHTALAARNSKERKFIEFLETHSIPPTIEQTLSGQGLENIHLFLTSNVLSAEKITKENNETLQLYSELLGHYLASLALSFLSPKGIYLGGGVSAKLLNLINRDCLLAKYLAPNPLIEIIRNTPVYLIKNEQAGLLGGAALAKSLLS